MTTITKPAKPTQAQIERATAVAAKLLRAHTDRQDRKPVTAAAFGRALVVTPPGSDHGKLLAATLRSGKWKDRPPEQRVVQKLARRGETPTAAAIASLRDGAAAHQAHLDRLRVQAGPFIGADGPRAAAHVAQVIQATGAGPTWFELARALGDWPRDNFTREYIIRGLATADWLETGTKPRSLRPGPNVNSDTKERTTTS